MRLITFKSTYNFLQPLMARCWNLLTLMRNNDRTGAELLHAVRSFSSLEVCANRAVKRVIGTLADDDIDADAWDVAFDRLRSEYLR